MSEYSKNKTNHPKKVKIPHAWIAEAAGASTEMVKKVRSGERKATGVKGQRIELASILLEQEASLLIQSIKKAVQL